MYISYHDFGVMKPKSNTKRDRLAAAYISNCGFNKRNKMVKELVQSTNGKVQSFGRCENSKHQEPPTGGVGPSGKLAALEHFKFSLAFENSETVDYVTEKFFGSLCSSSVPVVIGAPNIKFFAPDTTPYPYESNALLYGADFGDDSQRIASLLMALDKNDEAYAGLLAWKKTGYSDDYKALVDLGNVHSNCRACIAAADDLRHKFGPNVYDVRVLKTSVMESTMSDQDFVLFIRERGSYAFVRIGFQTRPNMRELIEQSLQHVPITPKNLWKDNDDLRNQPYPRVYAFYLPRPARLAVLSDEDIQHLPNGCELEMIVV
jgi:glycoprotein 3-alpha-L-fucosyltransferase